MGKITKAEKNRREDATLTRALIWFAAAMVLEFFLRLVNKYYINVTADSASIARALMLDKVLRWLAVVASLCGVGCAAYCLFRSRQLAQFQFGLSVAAAVLLTLGLSSAAIVRFWYSAVQVLFLVIPAAAVLALIYYLYQKEFFFCALASAIGLLDLWLIRHNAPASHPVLLIIYEIAAFLALAAIAVLTFRAGMSGGILKLSQRSVPLLQKGGAPVLILISCALSLLAGAAGTILGAAAAFYLMLLLSAWLFVLLVYYTVKLM